MKPARSLAIMRPAIAINVGSRFHVVAVPTNGCHTLVQTFQAFTGGLRRMLGWLNMTGITTAAMESARVYLERGYEDGYVASVRQMPIITGVPQLNTLQYSNFSQIIGRQGGNCRWR